MAAYGCLVEGSMFHGHRLSLWPISCMPARSVTQYRRCSCRLWRYLFTFNDDWNCAHLHFKCSKLKSTLKLSSQPHRRRQSDALLCREEHWARTGVQRFDDSARENSCAFPHTSKSASRGPRWCYHKTSCKTKQTPHVTSNWFNTPTSVIVGVSSDGITGGWMRLAPQSPRKMGLGGALRSLFVLRLQWDLTSSICA